MSNFEDAIARYEQGTVPATSLRQAEVTGRRPLDRVIPLRLRSSHWKRLSDVADLLDEAVSALARRWILERLQVEEARVAAGRQAGATAANGLIEPPVAAARPPAQPTFVPVPIQIAGLEQLAPFDPSPERYHHNRTGEDNGDAHHKRQIMGREIVVAVTRGKLDFGPWEQIFYGEFDGRRPKRALVKVIGE